MNCHSSQSNLSLIECYILRFLSFNNRPNFLLKTRSPLLLLIDGIELFLTPDGQGAERSPYWLNPISTVDLPGEGTGSQMGMESSENCKMQENILGASGKKQLGLPFY